MATLTAVLTLIQNQPREVSGVRFHHNQVGRPTNREPSGENVH